MHQCSLLIRPASTLRDLMICCHLPALQAFGAATESVFAIIVSTLEMSQLDLLYCDITDKWYKSLQRLIHHFQPKLKGVSVKKKQPCIFSLSNSQHSYALHTTL